MQARDLERASEGHEIRSVALIELGDIQGAKSDIAAMAELAEELRQPSHDWFVTAYRALFALLAGEFADAEDLISNARRVGERAQSWNAAVSYGLQVCVLRREQGRLAEVEELVRGSVAEYPTYPLWRCVLAHTAAELGQTDDARGVFETLAANGFATVPFDEAWLVSLSFLAETARVLGDAERASVLYDRLLPYGDRVAVSHAEISTGSVSRYLGILAATTARWNDAEDHFEAALEMNRRIGARPWLAHTQHDYARMLMARDKPGDGDRELELVREALDGYQGLGMHTFAAEAARLERSLSDAPAP